jgi:RND family efflux transporter MFP subunit
MNPTNPNSAPPPIRLGRVVKIVAILIVIGLLVGLVPRWLARQRLNSETKADSIPTVAVIAPKAASSDLGTPLPAEVQAYVEATIHARASGYLKNWLVDIGDVVTNGQTLGEIETPELDQQLAQAKAQLAQANAALGLAKITADRWTDLLKTASVSEQETAEKQAGYVLAQANVDAAQANVSRLEDLKSYDRITAPFAGKITSRNTDIGQLINADSGPELFRLAQMDPLRVYVRVPQTLVGTIVPGQTAVLTVQELPGKTFEATVTRTAGALEPVSRTLQVELQVPNPTGEILAGGYAQVRFNESADAPVLTLPDTTFIFRAQGMQVACVGGDSKVQLRSIKLGRDFGGTVEILDGVGAGDRIIVNPPDSIADGMTVQVAAPPQTDAAK